MRRYLGLGVIALICALALPATGATATQCSNYRYVTSVQKVNARALYAIDLMSSGLFNEAASAMSRTVRQHTALEGPCSSALRSVRSTYHSGLNDWYLATLAARRGSINQAISLAQRGTAKVKYATAQLKIINNG